MKLLPTILSALALAVGPSGLAAAEVLQASGEAGLSAVTAGDTARIGRAGDRPAELELPAGAWLYDLEATGSGWVAAGHVGGAGGTDLLLIEEAQGVTDLLELPDRGEGQGPERGQPVLLVERGRLVGLAWAAGSRQSDLEIWAAERLDEGWGPPERVSPRGAGSQLALDGAVLDDGGWLLVWSAFDGEDDETVWARRAGGEWSRPRRVHADNRVPDITPALIAIDGGALVAWSWFDGNDYRLRTARYLDGRWHEAKPFGARGSLEPILMASDDRLYLLYHTVAPPTWTVLELDRSGVPRRRAVVPEETYEQPLLRLVAGEPAELQWMDAAGGLEPQRARSAAWSALP